MSCGVVRSAGPEVPAVATEVATPCCVVNDAHVYQTGGHGCGLRRTDETVTTWPASCELWLRTIGVLPKKP